jgi:hypothetical protein
VVFDPRLPINQPEITIALVSPMAGTVSAGYVCPTPWRTLKVKVPVSLVSTDEIEQEMKLCAKQCQSPSEISHCFCRA